MNAKQIWQSALERIQPKISPATFTTWFSGTSAVSLTGQLLTVRVQNTFSRAHLESRFHDLICSVLSDLIGPGADVRFEMGQAEEPEMAQKGFLAHQQAAAVEGEAQELPLEGDEGLEPARQQRQPALMMVAAPRRERVEVAQEGRRLARRVFPYTGPELLPLADAPGAAPLLAHIAAPGGQESAAGPLNGHDLRAAEDHGVTTVVESTPPLDDPRPAGEPERAEEPPAPEQSALVPWTSTLPPRGLGVAESVRGNALPGGGEGPLNHRYTFTTFIVGKSNQLAHAASQAVADAPGKAYNPLVVYGGVGLGKTHLLHAIGHCGLAAGLNILYTTADRFTNEIINAIRFHTTEEFRAKYRQIDILLVDDIQFIAGKESTEEEFFHTFNTLHNANKQIVLTSDRPPKAIAMLHDRLRSRFEWGMLADVKPPEYEHRLAILRSKLEFFSGPDGLQLEIPDAVIEYIAQPECANVRELEGNLNRVIAYARLHNAPVTLQMAMEALQHLLTDSKPRALRPMQVLEAVARHYNVTLDALRGKQRDREIAWPRQVAMFLMREETKANLIQIAAELGGRDHSTVIYGANRVAEVIKNNDRFRKEVAILREELHILASQQEVLGE